MGLDVEEVVDGDGDVVGGVRMERDRELVRRLGVDMSCSHVEMEMFNNTGKFGQDVPADGWCHRLP